MNRRLTGLVAAIVLALVGTMILVGYVRSAEARALEGEELVNVLVVTDAIDAGTKAEDITASVRTEQVPAKIRAAKAITSLDDIEGLVAAVDLVPGEQVLADRFTETVSRARTGVPSGLLEVSIALDPERAVGGRVAPGDTVAVIASFDDMGGGNPATHLMLHKVLVTNVQITATDTDDDDEAEDDGTVAPTGSLLVTLGVDAASVEKIVFAAEHGNVWLSAEPVEAPTEGTRILTKASVFA
jgi:pilus assembly protein CpaB